MSAATYTCLNCHSAGAADSAGRCRRCGATLVDLSDHQTLLTQVASTPTPAVVLDAATEVTPSADTTPSGPLLAPPTGPGEIGRLGPYRVLGRIGVGGMGLVYRAEDPQLRRFVALKVMLPQFTADPKARARFLREARAAAAVEHDHIVPIFQVGEDRGVPFLAMPLLKGESLAARLKASGPLPLFHAVRIAREVAEGLSAAHAAGLIHRDVKPSNIWLEGERRRVRILDFGLARVVGQPTGESSRLLDKDVVGTPAYMAPEQGANAESDARSDLFSLGVVLYQMVAGHLPFKTGSPMATLTSIAMDDPPPPAELIPDLPPALNDLILRLLAKRPADRPATAAEVARRLADLEVGLTAAPLPAGDPFADFHAPDTALQLTPRPGRGVRLRGTRFGWVALAAFLLAVLGGAIGSYFLLPAPHGTLFVESADSSAEWIVKRNGTVVRDRTKDRRIGLPAGVYTVELADPKEGTRLSTDTVTIPRGGRVVVTVHRDRPAGPIDPDRDRQAATTFLYRKDFRVRVRVGDGPEVELVGGVSTPPAERFSVTGLTIPAAGVFGPEDVKRLTDLPKFTDLRFAGSRPQDAALGQFHALKGLTQLHLPGASLTDAGFKNVARVSGLTHLIVDHNVITDAGLADLATLTKLEILGLMGTGLTDGRLAPLRKLPNLSILNLSHQPISDAGMDYVTGHKKLTMLGLVETNVSDAGLIKLARLPELTTVYMRKSKVADAGLAALPEGTKLAVLDVSETAVSDIGLGHLVRVPAIKVINVKQTPVTETGVRKFAAARPDVTIYWAGGTIEPVKP